MTADNAALLTWSSSIETLDWDELAALYRAAPLGAQAFERGYLADS
ncbi:hypothetical protein QTH89_22615 [Variovorax sp. J22G21]|nr:MULTISPECIES: hypothetical protein [unclassified Variovorax]MDM0039246.1 hypothetical protein [Variovorax sp. J22R193]MDM0055150.1 hypothetical protein [Variovorax sp. J22G47]MDM0064022.1 hypothetical protein [Variovorax sp. J22G21]